MPDTVEGLEISFRFAGGKIRGELDLEFQEDLFEAVHQVCRAYGVTHLGGETKTVSWGEDGLPR